MSLSSLGCNSSTDSADSADSAARADSAFFAEAIRQGWEAWGISSPNPAVGAVIVDAHGTIVGRGSTQAPGGKHAEIVALDEAGERARGSRAYVTLEPCNHTGRTGPCAQALIAAGVAEVHYLFADPFPAAAGGAETLRAAGVQVVGPVWPSLADIPAWEPEASVEPWLVSVQEGRPHVTVKMASTLDGRIAAADGTSQWITGDTARRLVHEDRSCRDAIIVGTGTVAADNPRLTARFPDGTTMASERQPLRVVMGNRDLPEDAAIRGTPGQWLHVRSHDPREVLEQIARETADSAISVLVEGGPSIIAAFLAADLVDSIQFYAAPAVLGNGAAAVVDPTGQLGRTIGDIKRFTPRSITPVGQDVLWTLTRGGA